MTKYDFIILILCIFIFVSGVILGLISIPQKTPVKIVTEQQVPNHCIGEFDITFYTHTGNKTSTGVYPQIDRTIATDPNVIPYGSIIYVDGYGAFIAEDTGADIKNNRLDIFVDTKEEAIQKGRVKAKVYMIERE